MDPERLKMILAMVAPIIDAYVKASPTPIDNLAWLAIRKLFLSDLIADRVYSEMVAKGMAPPLPQA